MRKSVWVAILMISIMLTTLPMQVFASRGDDERTIPITYPISQEEYAQCGTTFGKQLEHENSQYYVNNDYYNMKSRGTLHLLPHFKTYQQTTEYTCGAASALMVLNHFGDTKYNEMQIAQLSGTDSVKGTSPEGLVTFFQDAGYKTDYHAGCDPRFQDADEAQQYFVGSIDAGIPVMVDWVDWSGHWQVVIGIDTMSELSPMDDVLILADPYDVTDHKQDGYYTFPFGRFFYMWREGVCAGKETPYEQPFVKVWKQR